MTPRDGLCYIGAQCGGAILGGTIAAILTDANLVTPTCADGMIHEGFWCEFLLTNALVYVVLNTASSPESECKSYFGVSIGLTVTIGAYSVGQISGGVFNPAVATGLFLTSAPTASEWESFWVYLVAPSISGVTAAGLYYLQHPPSNEIEMQELEE